MAYAIIKSGGKQIKVEVGSQIWVEKLNVEEGKKHEFNNVLAVSNGTKLEIGKPTLDAKVIAMVEKQGKGPKIKILRTKAKSNWKREVGHRQPYTRLLIEEIKLNDTLVAKADAKKTLVKKNTTKEVSKDKEEVREIKGAVQPAPKPKIEIKSKIEPNSETKETKLEE